MKFSYNWLKSFFKKKLPKPEKLAEPLTLHFAEVEEIKKEGKDFTLDIDVRPNRAGDCFCHMGIAREIATIFGYKWKIEDCKIIEDKAFNAKDFVSVEIMGRGPCPRYTAKVITNVKIASSPKWMQERLKACGLRPINNIVDIANYVMLETGQPLHAFDVEKLDGKKIVVRFAKKGEKIITLDEEKYDLNDDILVIADSRKPVAIAGIKGGKLPEIDKKTKIVVLESANFNPQVIRRGSRIISLKTDASLRFEHGIDPNLTEIAINRAAFLIQKIAKGKVAKNLIDIYPKKVLPKRTKLDLSYVRSLLGIDIPVGRAINILEDLGFKIKNKTPKVLDVEVPTRRLDVTLPEDLIEEIGRVYGYEKIPAKFPISSLVPPRRNLNIFWEDMAKNILKEAGFSEIYNYSFISENDKNIFGNKYLIEMENPISADYKYLRPSLIPNLLKNIQKNQKGSEKIKIFELGKIYKNDEKIEEKRMLTVMITGDEFYQLKGVVDLLLQKLGISNIWYDSWKPTPEESKISIWHPKKCAEIKIDNVEIGFLGEISSRILDNFKLKKVTVFDIDFEKLSQFCSEEHEYRPISRFPAAIRDIAILVPRTISVEEVLNKIDEAGGGLIRDIDLFDIYEGEELPGGKKNLAFHIIYQAENRTLKTEEIDKIHQKIIKTLEGEPEWQVRK